MSEIAEVFIIGSRSTMKVNPLGMLIEKQCGLGFTHYSIAIRYHGEIVISEAIWPRPRFVGSDDWLKSHVPVTVFRRCIDDHISLFEQMTWMAKLCTKSWYSLLQLVLIYIAIAVAPLKKWAQTVKLNNDNGLVCCEYITLYLNKFHPQDFEITVSEDSIGMKEPHEALVKTWECIDPEAIKKMFAT